MNRRTKAVICKLNDVERKATELRAQESALSLSEYVRHLIRTDAQQHGTWKRAREQAQRQVA